MERELEDARGALTDHQTQLERCQQELSAGRTERQYLETRITTSQSDCSSYVSAHGVRRQGRRQRPIRADLGMEGVATRCTIGCFPLSSSF